MKHKNVLLAVLLVSICGALSASVSITPYDRVGLSKTAPGQVIPSVEVLAGDMVVWANASNKKISVAELSFGVSAAGTVVVDEVTSNITDYGTVMAEWVFTNVEAATLLGGTDPNPNSTVAYLEISAGGVYDFTATSSGDLTASAMLYILRADSGELVYLASDAVEWNEDADLPLSLGYTWTTTEVYASIAVVEAASALKGTLTPANVTIDWSNENDGGDPVTYLPGLRENNSALTSGSVFASNYQFTFDASSVGKNSGSIVGAAFAEVPGSGGDTWKGYPVGDLGYSDTGNWLGWVNVTEDPYIYSVPFASWMYIPLDQSGEGGAWTYVFR